MRTAGAEGGAEEVAERAGPGHADTPRASIVDSTTGGTRDSFGSELSMRRRWVRAGSSFRKSRNRDSPGVLTTRMLASATVSVSRTRISCVQSVKPLS